LKNLSVKGFKASGISAGIKKNGKKDFALIVSETPCVVAGVFTKNSVKAAPVVIDMERIKKGSSRGVVINSGNANACTGKRGHKDALDILTAVEKELSLKKGDLLISSTGVIGDFLPKEKMLDAVPRLVKSLDVRGWVSATEAIRTTDTEAYLKTAFGTKNIGGAKVSILGIAKGAGMICPDMATMLSFFATDANIKTVVLKNALKEAIGLSFNRISVDNDASTNDTVLVFANKMSGGREIKYATKEYRAFTSLLAELALTLAKMIVRDGEGATKLIEIRIKGARSDKDAEKAARKIASSPLVKTAFFGGDPNWGRIVCAAGCSGARMAPDKVDVTLSGVKVVKNGSPVGSEIEAAIRLKQKDILLTVDFKLGKGSYTFWTSDLTHEYVRINSAYRS